MPNGTHIPSMALILSPLYDDLSTPQDIRALQSKSHNFSESDDEDDEMDVRA